MSELVQYQQANNFSSTHVESVNRNTLLDQQPPEPGRGDLFDLHQIITLLRRNLWLIICVSIAVLSVASYVVLRQKPQYRATAVIRLLDERSAITGGIEGAAMEQMMGGRFADPILSQLQVLKSRTVAGPVVDSLGLQLRSTGDESTRTFLKGIVVDSMVDFDTLIMSFRETDYSVVSGRSGETRAVYGDSLALGGIHFTVPERPAYQSSIVEVRPREIVIEWLLSNLRVAPRERTNIVDVSFISTDPSLSQAVVNNVVDEYRSVNARNAREQSRRRRIFIEEQLQQTDALLTEAQFALTEFQQREEVFSSQQKFSASQSGMMDLEMRKEELDADRRMLEGLVKGLTSGASSTSELRTLVSTPSVAANQVIVSLYEQLVRSELVYDSLTTGPWGSALSNPDVKRVATMVASTRTSLLGAIESHIAAIEARVAALDDLRVKHLSDMRSLPSTGAEEVRLVQRVETIRSMADQLRSEYQKARIAEAVEVGQMEIVDVASLPLTPIVNRKGIKLAGSLILGLMLGIGAAFLLEQLNTSIKRKEDIERLLKISVLAVIPRISGVGVPSRIRNFLPSRTKKIKDVAAIPIDSSTSGLVTISDLRSFGSEAYRTLRTNLIFSQAVQSIRTLVITSASPSEGKTTTAGNLAVTFAQQGMKVLLVDCDLRKPRQHEVFGVPREPGLTQLVLGFNDISQSIRSTAVDGLHIMPSGTLPPNPSDFLGGDGMRSIVSQLNSEYDLVILDTCPLLVASDAAVLGRSADGVLLVIRASKTDKSAAQYAVTQLRSVGAKILGAVLNDPEGRVESYGGYYYYSKYYGDEKV